MNLTEKQIQNTALLPDQTALWYLGQEGFLIKSTNSYLGVDLYLSDYVDRRNGPDSGWKRKYPAPIAADRLRFLNAVLCTHAHADHMDPDTLSLLAKDNPKTRFVIPAPCVTLARRYGIAEDRIIPAHAGKSITIDGFTVTPIPAAHECFHRDENGDYAELSYIIRTGNIRIFHGGDLCMYDGLAERLPSIDVALLPVNGRDYFRNREDIIGNLTCGEAVLLAKEIGAGLLIPMHHDLYAVNGVTHAEFTAAAERLGMPTPFHIFSPGEKYIIQKTEE